MRRAVASSSILRHLAVVALFSGLTVVLLLPLSVNLFGMVPEPTDPLLNAWRLQWNARAFLSGPDGIANLFNTNILYPYPLTLAYSEHFLMLSAQALPFLLLAESHLFGLNLSVLLTFVLSGYAMYLLAAGWTGSRWAGVIAGLLFAFSQQRFGQLNHLEVLVNQWLPLSLLALHWLLTRPGKRYALLFIIFVNLQALSGFHFTLNLVLACGLLAVVYIAAGRVAWRWGLAWAAGLAGAVTLLLNWPLWRVYLRFSDVMGAIRTPGEVRIYSAALTDYFTAIPHNLLYGWTFGRWQPPDHQFQPLMPVGLAGLLLAGIGLAWGLARLKRGPGAPTVVLGLLLVLTGLLLSFGLNENALGAGLAPLLSYSPYAWLYEHVVFFQGIRVPGRFSALVLAGLAILAGWGLAAIFNRPARRPAAAISGLVLAVLALLEAWSVPLVGPEFPAGRDIPAVYHWLQRETPAETVVMELPSGDSFEFLYEYYSSHHWRRLANGSTGFTPPVYRELRRWLGFFPDARSVDVVQQLGIDLVILHPGGYKPEDWQRVLADLPLYLPAFERVRQVGDALVLAVAPPSCLARPEAVAVSAAPAAGLDGFPNAVAVTYANHGPAAFTSDVQQPARLIFSNGAGKNFTGPAVVPAGETFPVVVPLRERADVVEVILPGFDPAQAAKPPDFNPAWQPLGLTFAGGPQLAAYDLGPEPLLACGELVVALNWQGGRPGDKAVVQLLDPYGRPAAENVAFPWDGDSAGRPDIRRLPLVGPLPPGRYGLRVRVASAGGQERPPVTGAGVTIPPDQTPPLPVVIHPAPVNMPEDISPAGAVLDTGVRLLGSRLVSPRPAAGGWLRFTLFWEALEPVERDLTVFTQLLGPDGRVWGQQDHQPKGGWYATSLWLPGRVVADDYAFQVADGAPPGEYRLIAGMYDPQTLERLPVTGAGAAMDYVELGLVRLGE